MDIRYTVFNGQYTCSTCRYQAQKYIIIQINPDGKITSLCKKCFVKYNISPNIPYNILRLL